MRQLRPALRRTALATASGLLFVGAAAQAQQPNAGPTPSTSVPQALASTTQLETVVVTGIRRSLETSVNLKRSSSGLVDGIVPETEADQNRSGRAADARRAERAYPGRVNLTDALKWLYPDLADGSVNALAQRFEADFDMTARTTRKIIAEERAGMMAPTWVATFVAALRHFDRKSWSRTQ